MAQDEFLTESDADANGRRLRSAAAINSRLADYSSYETIEHFQAAQDLKNPFDIHTTPELIEALRAHPDKYELDARVLVRRPDHGLEYCKLDRAGFLEAIARNDRSGILRESSDPFSYDDVSYSTGRLGEDFTPLLGGPFFKQLYIYDYLRMHSAAFFAYHHDALANLIVKMTRDFVLGRGYRVDIEEDREALALWRAFEEANNLPQLIDQATVELSVYGETMPWFLPGNEVNIAYRVSPGQEPAKGLLPRIRLLDPSAIWEIVTYPEDINRVLYYQWIAPTQYQIYTGSDAGKPVPSTKFIFQQVPAKDVLHERVNAVSNEKRGRSDLFPILGHLKRLRDTVNYAITADQKKAAWAIDTTVEGSLADLQAYVADQQAMGTVAPAGSEFVHTSKIKREFLAPQSGSKGSSNTFEWVLSMIAAGSGFPVSYFGTHISGGQTKASAIVATEPVAKKLQKRQLTLETLIKRIAKEFFRRMNHPMPDDFEVTFPEIIIQDRSAKLKDLALSESEGWISKRRAASIAAKELGITDYDFEDEQAEILADGGPQPAPLTDEPVLTPGDAMGGDTPSAGVTSADRRQISINDRNQ